MRRRIDIWMHTPAQVRELVRTALPDTPESRRDAAVSVASELAAMAVEVCDGTLTADAHDGEGALQVTLEGWTAHGALPTVDRYRRMVIEGLSERWDAELGPRGHVRFDAIIPGGRNRSEDGLPGRGERR